MALYLLDTDAIVDYLQRIPGSLSLIMDLFDRGDSLCICDIVIAEVYSGLRPEAKDKAQDLLYSLLYLPTTLEAARQAGEWRYQYARQGVTLSPMDMLIAATAHAHKASIVTGNKKDYPMDEVSLVLLPRAGLPER